MDGRLDVRVRGPAARNLRSRDGYAASASACDLDGSQAGARDLAFPKRRCPDGGSRARRRAGPVATQRRRTGGANRAWRVSGMHARAKRRAGHAHGDAWHRMTWRASREGGAGRAVTTRRTPGYESRGNREARKTGGPKKDRPEKTRGGTSRLTGRVGGRREIPPRLSTRTGRGSEQRRVAESLGTGRRDPMGLARQRQPSLPASPAASIALATRPEFCRIAASIEDMISGCSFKKLREFSRPWPMRWPS